MIRQLLTDLFDQDVAQIGVHPLGQPGDLLRPVVLGRQDEHHQLQPRAGRLDQLERLEDRLPGVGQDLPLGDADDPQARVPRAPAPLSLQEAKGGRGQSGPGARRRYGSTAGRRGALTCFGLF